MLIAGVLTVGLAGCAEKEPEIPNEPFLDIIVDGTVNNNPTLDVGKEGGTLSIEVNSSRNWTMDAVTASWLHVSPQSGNQNVITPVNIEVDPNTGAERKYKLVFKTVDGANTRTVSIIQDGDGTTGELIYFEDLGDFKSGSTIRSISGVASPSWPTIDQYGSVDPSTAWRRAGDVDQSTVTYTGTSQVRNSGETYDPAAGSSISGPAYIYMGKSQTFEIEGVNLGGASNLTFTFSAQNTISAPAPDYIPTFGPIEAGVFTLEAGFDGQSWAELTFTGELDGNNWYWATSEFKVPDGTAKLYFRFSGFTTGTALRLDDFTLNEGGDGSMIDPSGESMLTIAQLNERITTTSTPVGNYYTKGIVTTDMANGNFTDGSLSIMTEGATTAGNGILLYGEYNSGIKFVDGEGNPLYAAGDEIQIDLSTLSLKAQRGSAAAAADPYCHELIIPTGTVLTDIITRTGHTATITPVTITYDQIADFQNMVVQIEEVQSEANDITTWAAGSTSFTYHDDTAKKFPVYLADASSIVGTDFNTESGTVIGLAYVYTGSSTKPSQAQLAPRSAADLAGLTEDRYGIPADYFTVNTSPVAVAAAGGTYTVNVSANVAWQAEVVAGATAVLTAGPTPASGDDSQTISLTFEANSVASPKTLTLRISTAADVATQSYDVVFNQGGYIVGTPFSAAWNFGSRATAPADIVAATEVTGSTGVTVGSLTPENFTGSGAQYGWGGTGFNVTTVAAATRFATVTFEAPAGKALYMTSISANIRRSGTGAAKTAVQYKLGTGGTYVDITDWAIADNNTSGTDLSYDLSGIAALQNVAAGIAVTIRLVPYNASGATGSWYLNGNAAAGHSGVALTIGGSIN